MEIGLLFLPGHSEASFYVDIPKLLCCCEAVYNFYVNFYAFSEDSLFFFQQVGQDLCQLLPNVNSGNKGFYTSLAYVLLALFQRKAFIIC